jgi:hypothetical protein
MFSTLSPFSSSLIKRRQRPISILYLLREKEEEREEKSPVTLKNTSLIYIYIIAYTRMSTMQGPDGSC